jgi:hypothetical protein
MIHTPQLSPGRRALVEAAADIQYGCLENIPFRQGEPDVSRMRVVRDVKLGRRESPRARVCQSTVLKRQFSELWEHLDRAQNYQSPPKRRAS